VYTYRQQIQTILVYLHSFSCCCVPNRRYPRNSLKRTYTIQGHPPHPCLRLPLGDEIWYQKTRIVGLPDCEEIMTFWHNTSAWRTDRRTRCDRYYTRDAMLARVKSKRFSLSLINSFQSQKKWSCDGRTRSFTVRPHSFDGESIRVLPVAKDATATKAATRRRRVAMATECLYSIYNIAWKQLLRVIGSHLWRRRISCESASRVEWKRSTLSSVFAVDTLWRLGVLGEWPVWIGSLKLPTAVSCKRYGVGLYTPPSLYERYGRHQTSVWFDTWQWVNGAQPAV